MTSPVRNYYRGSFIGGSTLTGNYAVYPQIGKGRSHIKTDLEVGDFATVNSVGLVMPIENKIVTILKINNCSAIVELVNGIRTNVSLDRLKKYNGGKQK